MSLGVSTFNSLAVGRAVVKVELLDTVSSDELSDESVDGEFSKVGGLPTFFPEDVDCWTKVPVRRTLRCSASISRAICFRVAVALDIMCWRHNEQCGSG